MLLTERHGDSNATGGQNWRQVCAGDLTAELDGASLRRVRLGRRVVADHIYVAVRDAAWNTIPAVISDMDVRSGDGEFLVKFVARHIHDTLEFSWTGVIQGRADSTILYQMDGRAASRFRYARIGLNVHHGAAEYAGRVYRAGLDEDYWIGELPRDVGPQAIRDGTLRGVVEPLHRFEVRLDGDLLVSFSFEGEEFEVEDQRNFGDATFKTYATPLSRPWPSESDPATAYRQSVTMSVVAANRPSRIEETEPVTFSIGERLWRPLPRIGFGVANSDGPLSARELERVRALRPAHLRLDLRPGDDDAASAVARAAGQAAGVGAKLEVAILVGSDVSSELEAAVRMLTPTRDQLEVILVFAPPQGALDRGTPAEILLAARNALGGAFTGVPIGGGSDVFFASVNRTPPNGELLDVLAYPISPTVHLADDATIVEGLACLGDSVRRARKTMGGRPVRISPITLATRHGPYPNGPALPGELPPGVDARQASLLGAAWTVGAVAELADAGADALTVFETVGWRGVVERDAGSPMPARFPSSPGDVFPMWHVFAWLASLRDSEVLGSTTSDPWRAVGLAALAGDSIQALVASVSTDEIDVEIGPLPEGRAHVWILDDVNVADATNHADTFVHEAMFERSVDRDGRLRLHLRPYAIAGISLIT